MRRLSGLALQAPSRRSVCSRTAAVPDLAEFLRPPCTSGLSVSSGCSNFCRYCFVEHKAHEMGVPWRMRNLPRGEVMERARSISNEVVQVPVTHDITPRNVDLAMDVIAELVLRNEVVVVTKPFKVCIDKITERFSHVKDTGSLAFRLSITSDDEDIVKRWEPGASPFAERLNVLKDLHASGWRTGLSIAPMLDIPNVVRMYRTLEPFVSDTIYVAKLAEGQKLWPRGRLRESDIERLRSEHRDVELLNTVHAELSTSKWFAPKFCVYEYDPWAFGSETEFYDELRAHSLLQAADRSIALRSATDRVACNKYD